MTALIEVVKANTIEQQQLARMEIAQKYAEKNANIIANYSAWMSEKILRDPDAIFVGKRCPYRFTWVAVGAPYNGAHDIAYRESLIASGYAPADLRARVSVDNESVDKFEIVIGEEAALLSLNESLRSHFERLQQNGKGMRMPHIPQQLETKIGFLTPPIVDKATGFAYSGYKQLWFCLKEQWEQTQARYDKMANTSLIQPAPAVSLETKTDFFKGASPEDVVKLLNG